MELLNGKEHRFLKLIYKKDRTNSFLLNRLHVDYKTLVELANGQLSSLIICTINSENWEQGTVRITLIGKAVVEDRRKSDRRWRIPFFLSVIAIMLSIIALLHSTGLLFR